MSNTSDDAELSARNAELDRIYDGYNSRNPLKWIAGGIADLKMTFNSIRDDLRQIEQDGIRSEANRQKLMGEIFETAYVQAESTDDADLSAAFKRLILSDTDHFGQPGYIKMRELLAYGLNLDDDRKAELDQARSEAGMATAHGSFDA